MLLFDDVPVKFLLNRGERLRETWIKKKGEIMLTCYDVANYFLAKYGTSSKVLKKMT